MRKPRVIKQKAIYQEPKLRVSTVEERQARSDAIAKVSQRLDNMSSRIAYDMESSRLRLAETVFRTAERVGRDVPQSLQDYIHSLMPSAPMFDSESLERLYSSFRRLDASNYSLAQIRNYKRDAIEMEIRDFNRSHALAGPAQTSSTRQLPPPHLLEERIQREIEYLCPMAKRLIRWEFVKYSNVKDRLASEDQVGALESIIGDITMYREYPEVANYWKSSLGIFYLIWDKTIGRFL